MGYGVTIPKGALPVFSVDTEEEAERLLLLTCPTNLNHEYVAPELVREQTLGNLTSFARRLKRGYDLLHGITSQMPIIERGDRVIEVLQETAHTAESHGFIGLSACPECGHPCEAHFDNSALPGRSNCSWGDYNECMCSWLPPDTQVSEKTT